MKMESLVLLQKLEDLATNSISLQPHEEDLVKSTFKEILNRGDTYNVTELEAWFASKSKGGSSAVIERIMNIAHYQKSKFDASNKFRMVSDGNDCSCGCGGH